jgi:hypothetical protein
MIGNRKILVIGNGPSVLNHKVGDLIDTYDDVVRFNNYELKTYEEFVGTKTTILARRACDDVKLHPSELFNKVLCFITYCKWTDGMTKVARDVKSFYGEKCEIVSWLKCREIGEQIGLQQPHKEWASIGVLTIALLVERFGADNITIHGFDGLNSLGEREVFHYFNTPPKDAMYHSGIKERIFIESLGLDKLV